MPLSLLLQAQPAPPPNTPWWAVVGGPLLGLVISGLFTLLVARAQQKAPDAQCKTEIPALKKTQAEHGETLAAHGKVLEDHEQALAERTDPASKAHKEATSAEKLRALEASLNEFRAEQRAKDEARHETDRSMERVLGRIEGALGRDADNGGSRGRR